VVVVKKPVQTETGVEEGSTATATATTTQAVGSAGEIPDADG
jgi:hypothetical protein